MPKPGMVMHVCNHCSQKNWGRRITFNSRPVCIVSQVPDYPELHIKTLSPNRKQDQYLNISGKLLLIPTDRVLTKANDFSELPLPLNFQNLRPSFQELKHQSLEVSRLLFLVAQFLLFCFWSSFACNMFNAYHLFTHMCICVCILQRTCGSQRTIYRSQLFFHHVGFGAQNQTIL